VRVIEKGRARPPRTSHIRAWPRFVNNLGQDSKRRSVEKAARSDVRWVDGWEVRYMEYSKELYEIEMQV